MKDLHFNVEGQRLTKANDEDFKGIVSKSKGYLRCMFNFDDEWTGTKRAAIFSTTRSKLPMYPTSNYASAVMRIDNVSCKVPDVVTDGNVFYVKIFGKKTGLELETNWIMIEQEA